MTQEPARSARRPLWLRVGLWLLVGAALAAVIIGVLLSPIGSADEFEEWLDECITGKHLSNVTISHGSFIMFQEKE